MICSAISLESETSPSLSFIKRMSESGEYLICINITSLKVALFRRSVYCNYKRVFFPVFVNSPDNSGIFNFMCDESSAMANNNFVWKYQCINDFIFFKTPEFDAFDSVQSKFYRNIFTFCLNNEAYMRFFSCFGNNFSCIHKNSLYYRQLNVKKDYNSNAGAATRLGD